MSAYYKGPGGVFYNKALDDIFILERTDESLVNKKTMDITGRFYKFWARGKFRKKTVLVNMRYAVRLGDL